MGYDISLPVSLLEKRKDIKTRCFCCGRIGHKCKVSSPVRLGTVSVLRGRCRMSPQDFYLPNTLAAPLDSLSLGRKPRRLPFHKNASLNSVDDASKLGFFLGFLLHHPHFPRKGRSQPVPDFRWDWVGLNVAELILGVKKSSTNTRRGKHWERGAKTNKETCIAMFSLFLCFLTWTV